jgi:hypothetical protein
VNPLAFSRSSTHATPLEARRWECYIPTYLPTYLPGYRGVDRVGDTPPAIRRSPRISATTAVRTAVASSTRRLKIVSAQPVADATHLGAT